MSKEVNSIPDSANLEINFSRNNSNQDLRQENWFPEMDSMISNYAPSNSVDIANNFHNFGENLASGSRVCGPSRFSSEARQGQFGHLLALAHAAAPKEFENSAQLGNMNGVMSSFSNWPVYKPQFDTGRYEASSATSSPAKQDVPYGLTSWGNNSCVPDMNLNGNSTPTRFIYDLNSPPTSSMDAYSSKNTPSHFAPITPDHSRKSDHGNAIQSLNLDGKTTQVHDNKGDGIAITRVETDELVDKELQQLPKDLSSIDNPEIDLNKTPQQKPKRKKHRPKVVTEGKLKKTPKPATPKPPKENPTTKRKYVRKDKVSSENSCKRALKFDLEEEMREERDICSESQAQNFFTRVESTSTMQLGEGLEFVLENTQVGLAYDLNCSINKAVKEYISLPERETIDPQTPNKTDLNHDHAKGKSLIVLSDEVRDRQARGLKRGNLLNIEDQNVIGGNCNPVPQYLAMFQENPYNGSNAIPGMHFPAIHKKKRTEKVYCSTISSTVHDVKTYVAPQPTYYNSPGVASFMDSRVNEQNLECELSAIQKVKMTKKRSKVPTRVRDFSSLMGRVECGQFASFHKGKEPIFGDVQTHGPWNNSPKSIQALVVETQVTMQKKKRTKRLSFTTSTSTGVLRKKPSTVEEITELLERLDLNSERNQVRNQQKRELAPFNFQPEDPNALVVYQHDGTIVPFTGSFGPIKKRKPRPKVDIDEETNKVWRLLLENINNEGIDGTDDEKAKWWDEERRVFQGRADSFIARMHLVQGDRRFSPWKGSVLDSVVGVFLTQNVSDHLSSSAFMSLAARFPLGSKSSSSPSDEGTSTVSKEPEVCLPDLEDTIHTQGETSNNNVAKEVVNDNESLGKSNSSKNSTNNMTSNFLGIFGKGLQIDDNTISNREAIKKPWESSVREREVDDALSSHFSAGSSKESVDSSFAQTSFVELLQMAASSHGQFNRRADVSSCKENESADIMGEAARLKSLEIVGNESEQSGVTVESVSHVMFQNNGAQIDVESYSKAINVKSSNSSKRKGKSEKQQKESTFNWDSLRVEAQAEGKRGERRADTVDSLDWEAVRCAHVDEIADTIKERGMNNKLAERIQDLLNRLVDEHGSTEIEWLRDVPPDKAKEYLLSIRGLGLKSVECVRLLTLHHLAFPVDTNVGRIAVRLGWVPLQPLPESLQLHLLELYPVLNSIQKYLWPRLCKLDQRTLYELHYQMITFGKVFCTKSKPNCNACPMRGECRHFASAFASARLALPNIDEKSIVSATEMNTAYQSPVPSVQQLQLPSSQYQQQCVPTFEVPSTPEPIVEVPATPEFEEPEQIPDIEDIICEDPDEIPLIKLNLEEFTQTLQNYMHHNMELQEGDVSKALVALTPEAASIPTPKLKNVNRLRTEHSVYELPDSHPLLEGLDKREPDDPCSYLLAIWTPGETANSITPPEGKCSAREVGSLCDDTTCFSCNSIREANSQTVRGTLLIPCRTAMRGSFPLNGTYFQVNEVFADHDSSINPIDVPRSWIWNLPRRTVYFGTSIPSIFKGLSTESIQYCFWRGFVCVRGFDQKTRGPRPLMARLHFPASRLKTQGKPTDKQE